MLLTVDLGRLEVGAGDWLLDVGCGEGRHCFGALELGARVVGIDMDRAALCRSSGALRARTHERGGSGTLIQGDAFQLPFRDGTFDRVICSEVMEHVPDPCSTARELARVTRTGGSVAITVPTALSEHLYLRLGDDYFETPGGHVRIFRPRDLARTLLRAGLRTTSVGFAHAFHTPYWALRSIVGLPRADDNALVRLYREFLIRATGSVALRAVEQALNHVCPKSLILYGRRLEAPQP